MRTASSCVSTLAAGGSETAGKAREGRHCLQPRLDIAQEDFRSQEGDLAFRRRLADVDVPPPRSSIAAVAPHVAAPLQYVLQFEGRLFGPDPDGPFSGLLQQDRKRRRARGRQFDGKDLDEA